MPMISLEKVNKYYKLGEQSFLALDAIDLSIRQNEYIAVVGQSGSGKSTLMNIFGCLDTPSSGNFWMDGKEISNCRESELAVIRNQKVGFIFQNFNLLSKLSALENVMQPLVYRFIMPKKRREMAMEALSRVGLGDKAGHLPNQLSGGQRQRVAIARALVCEPSILLADEPTGNLDSKTTKSIMALFDELHGQGHTIVLVTHEQDIADHCRRVIKLVDGRIQLDTTSSALRERVYV